MTRNPDMVVSSPIGVHATGAAVIGGSQCEPNPVAANCRREPMVDRRVRIPNTLQIRANAGPGSSGPLTARFPPLIVSRLVAVSFPSRIILAIVGAFALCPAGVQASPNVLEVVVGNGPLAGSYKPPVAEVICLHAKKQKVYSAAWKGFNAHDAKSIAEAGISVSNPDDAGAKYGDVRIAFGDQDKKPTVYSVNQAPLMLTIKGKGAEVAFQGKTKDGIQLRVTAQCLDVEEM
jgi:hypothetical protein